MDQITGEQLVKGLALLAAGLSMGLGAVGPGIGEGFVGGKACEAIGKRPDEANLITKTMIIGQAISETTGIYALVVALILIFVV
jgi:F-type H+-transporting ATPase subunit c